LCPQHTFLHRALPGNNFYGIYSSFKNIRSPRHFEPYVLWRLAPGKLFVFRNRRRGHLNEVTIGLHWKGTLPSEFDYDTEFDGQKGSLGVFFHRRMGGLCRRGQDVSHVVAAPRIYLEGNYASGTKNPAGRDLIL